MIKKNPKEEQCKTDIKLEDIKIIFDSESIPSWLPKEVKDGAEERFNRLKARLTHVKNSLTGRTETQKSYSIKSLKEDVDNFDIVKNIVLDDRMKKVWIKLYKINKYAAIKFFDFLSGWEFLRNITKEMVEDSGHIRKISITRSHLKMCEDFIKKLEQNEAIYSSYNPSAPKSNSRLYLHGDVTDAFYSGFEIYMDGLKQIIDHYEKHIDVFNRVDYMRSPVSRKRSIKNSKAIYWARLIKIHFLENYKRPLNKELAEILSVLFDEIYDADYVAKITGDVESAYKEAQKMEDSPDIYNYKPSF